MVKEEVLFTEILKNLEIVIRSELYTEKDAFSDIKKRISNMFNIYKADKSLKKINAEEIKSLDLEITDLFDKYLKIERQDKNYMERIYFDFDVLEHIWKEEIMNE